MATQSTNDFKRAFLIAKSVTGTINDMFIKYLKARSSDTSDKKTFRELLDERLLALGYTGSTNAKYKAFLAAQTSSSTKATIQDMENIFYANTANSI